MALYEQLGEEAVWSTETSAEDTVVRLVAQNDGNLVLYKPGHSSSEDPIPIWGSKTFNRCPVDGKFLLRTILFLL